MEVIQKAQETYCTKPKQKEEKLSRNTKDLKRKQMMEQ
jgi:hypothetical protein